MNTNDMNMTLQSDPCARLEATISRKTKFGVVFRAEISISNFNSENESLEHDGHDAFDLAKKFGVFLSEKLTET